MNLRDALLRASRQLEVPEPGGDGEWRVEHRPEPGVRVRSRHLDPDGQTAYETLEVEAADEAPPAYPDGMPFLPSVDVSVSRWPEPDRVALLWTVAADEAEASSPLTMLRRVLQPRTDVVKEAEALADELEAACAADGWSRTTPLERPRRPVRRRVRFERDERVRRLEVIVTADGGGVVLTEFSD